MTHQQNRWSDKADLPATATDRAGHLKICAVNNKAYLINTETGKVHSYDPTIDTWVQKTSRPTTELPDPIPSHSSSIVTVNNTIAEYNDYDDMVAKATTDGYYFTKYDRTKPPIRKRGLYKKEGNVFTKASTTGKETIHIISNIQSLCATYDPNNDTWGNSSLVTISKDVISSTVNDGKIYTLWGIRKKVRGDYLSNRLVIFPRNKRHHSLQDFFT